MVPVDGDISELVLEVRSRVCQRYDLAAAFFSLPLLPVLALSGS